MSRLGVYIVSDVVVPNRPGDTPVSVELPSVPRSFGLTALF